MNNYVLECYMTNPPTPILIWVSDAENKKRVVAQFDMPRVTLDEAQCMVDALNERMGGERETNGR